MTWVESLRGARAKIIGEVRRVINYSLLSEVICVNKAFIQRVNGEEIASSPTLGLELFVIECSPQSFWCEFKSIVINNNIIKLMRFRVSSKNIISHSIMMNRWLKFHQKKSRVSSRNQHHVVDGCSAVVIRKRVKRTFSGIVHKLFLPAFYEASPSFEKRSIN